MKRTAAAVLSVFSLFGLMLVAAPAALAENGEGWAGSASDKTVTFFCFGVILFFALIPIVGSLIQGRLERRKERRRADIERLS